MTTKTKPVEGWVVVTPNGKIIVSTFMSRITDAVSIFLTRNTDLDIQTMKEVGFRAVRATLKVNE